MSDHVAAAPGRSARKPKGEGHERRAEILAAAERIFVQRGYEGATIRKIADEVGLSSTALYMHFRDKSEILAEICKTAFARLLAGNAAISASGLSPEARLRALSSGYAQFAFDNPNAYRLIYLTRPHEAADGADAAAQALGAELYAHFLAAVGAVGETGRLRGEVSQAAQILWAGVHGIVSLIITKPYFDWDDSDALVEGMLDTLFAGLLKP